LKLSIIMYHYVRELRRSRFPSIKGLETDEFREQIAYIKKHYNVISGADLLAAAEARAWEALPPAPLLLTFDDGYADHFTQVFPILRGENLPGCFFPPAACILDRRILDVNKIHFVLAAVPEPQRIVDRILRTVAEYGPACGARSGDYYWTKLAVASRFDGKEVVFIKRALQRELPEPLRQPILDQLFREYVTADDISFANELYMSEDQIACLHGSGMYIGGHGHGHYWLDCLDREGQQREIELTRGFLRRVGTRLDGWIIGYPHGAYDDALLKILESAACRIGLTTSVGIADLGRDTPLTLRRLNANDLPKRGDAAPNDWTIQATRTVPSRGSKTAPPVGAPPLPHAAKVSHS
jgi:peptidoglycan/xylan/chitin deacetylase (PgdA/CDA1 family)